AGEPDAVDGIEEAPLERLAEPRCAPVEGGSAPALESISAEELVELLVARVAEADDVDAVRTLRPAHARPRFELREFAARTARHPQVVHEVVPERAARIAQAARVLPRRGVEEDAHGFQRLRAQDDHARAHLLRLARDAVDVEHAARAPRRGVGEHL